jgi:hypothetical protein
VVALALLMLVHTTVDVPVHTGVAAVQPRQAVQLPRPV